MPCLAERRGWPHCLAPIVQGAASGGRDNRRPKFRRFDQVNDEGEAARKITLAKRTDWGGLLVGALTGEPDTVSLPAPEGEWQLFFEKPLAELWVALRGGE